MTATSDPFHLARFVEAQADCYDRVCDELAAGRKQSHWMWFIFPQLVQLGRSPMARQYGLADLSEARAYDAHDVLGPRLRQCASLLLTHEGQDIAQVMGQIDALKLRSCATLFEKAAMQGDLFVRLLSMFYDGARCELSLEIMEGPA